MSAATELWRLAATDIVDLLKQGLVCLIAELPLYLPMAAIRRLNFLS